MTVIYYKFCIIFISIGYIITDLTNSSTKFTDTLTTTAKNYSKTKKFENNLKDEKRQHFTKLTYTTSTKDPLNNELKDTRYWYNEKIVNPHNFNYILNPGYNVCGSVENFVNIIVYVHSTPKNYKRRIAMRETWASRSIFQDMRVVFLMGATSDKKVMKLLTLEAHTYNDIVQEDFVDSYKNLTYKGILGMKWISEYCPQAKYVLKTDDDIFSNVFIIMRHLKQLEKIEEIKPKTIWCMHYPNRAMPVMRIKSKWYVSKKEFTASYFGPYCSGSAFIMTGGKLIEQMFKNSFHIKFFWVDDFYITGLLAGTCNVTYESYGSLYQVFPKRIDAKTVHSVEHIMAKNIETKTFAHLPGKQNALFRLWEKALENQLNKFPLKIIDFNWESSFE